MFFLPESYQSPSEHRKGFVVLRKATYRPAMRNQNSSIKDRIRQWNLYPGLSAGILAGLWAVVGSIVLLLASASGARAEVLWSIASTLLLSYSTGTALAGIFSARWVPFTLWCLFGYVALASVLAFGVIGLKPESMKELGEFKEMYAAFFLSFFMITGVAGAVRAIASFLGMKD